MPVNPCSENGQPGFKWGESGKCYLYTRGDAKSMGEAKRKATVQGLATGEYSNKANEVSTETMGSGIKNPQQGYPQKKKPKKINEKEIDSIFKNLKEWFREDWVDLSRPKKGGGYEPCGRADAGKGKYPKCVPASRAARMTPEQIASAIRRKRRAESTETRQDKKPIYVSTEKASSMNVPTNPALYARVKAEAKAKFDVYPSAYANAWLVREYKKRGGGYRTVSKAEAMTKVAEDLTEEESGLYTALLAVAEKYGKFDKEGSGIWIGYESAEKNDDKAIGVYCNNCALYSGESVCKILSMQVEDYGKCRFAIIPDNLVMPENEIEDEGQIKLENEMKDEGEYEENSEEKDTISRLINLIRDILNIQGEKK